MLSIEVGKSYESGLGGQVKIIGFDKESPESNQYEGNNGHWYNRSGVCFSDVQLMDLIKLI